MQQWWSNYVCCSVRLPTLGGGKSPHPRGCFLGCRQLIKIRQRHFGAVMRHQHTRRGIRHLYRAAIEFALLWLRAIHWHAAIEAAQVQIIGLGSGQNQLLRKRGTVCAPVCAECVRRAAVDVGHAWAAGWEVYDVLGCHAGILSQKALAIRLLNRAPPAADGDTQHRRAGQTKKTPRLTPGGLCLSFAERHGEQTRNMLQII